MLKLKTLYYFAVSFLSFRLKQWWSSGRENEWPTLPDVLDDGWNSKDGSSSQRICQQ